MKGSWWVAVGCVLAALLFAGSVVQLVVEVYKAHTEPHVCYDIVHRNYVSCEGHRP